MRVAVFGGAGFVGLNVVEQLLGAGDDVVLVDRAAPPQAALDAFGALPGKLDIVTCDINAAAPVRQALAGADGAVYGAAITSGAEREAATPRAVLEVNLLGFTTVLEAARAAEVRRVVNLSSASAYGEAAFGSAPLDEARTLPDPRTLYAISKAGSERVGARLKDLWGLDVRSFRLSSVFGPWERSTGVRDTLSPPYQVMRAALGGERVCFERSDVRDWLYAPDIGRAVRVLLRHPSPAHDIYNLGPGRSWDLVAWTERLKSHFPDLAFDIEPERATIQTHAPRQRQMLAVTRLAELGLGTLTDMAASADHYAKWALAHRAIVRG